MISKNIISFTEYLIVFFIVILSGSIVPFVFTDNYSGFLIMLLMLLIVAWVIVFKNKKIKISNTFMLLFLMISLLLMFLFKQEFNYAKEYLGMIIRIIIAFGAVMLIDKEIFMKKFVNIIFYISCISIFFYSIGVVFPSFIYELPLIFDDVGTGFRCLYIYFYQGVNIWNFRNTGIFWEPGAFQIFINLALIFEMYYFKSTNKKRMIIFSLAVISTISTVGISILFLVLFNKLIKMRSNIKYLIMALLIACIMLSGAIETLFLAKIGTNNASGVDRWAGQMADIEVFLQSPLFGAGYRDYFNDFTKYAYYYGAILPNSSNSFTLLLALNGIIYSSVFVSSVFLFFNQITENKIEKAIIFCSIIAMLSTEGMLIKLLFICFLFYGLESLTNRKRLRV